jgi:murein DD-endopeptidase MepM/ murein hydrolase activator NlpD
MIVLLTRILPQTKIDSMDTITPVDDLQHASAFQPDGRNGDSHAVSSSEDTALPPEQVLGLVMLVSALNSIQPGRRGNAEMSQPLSLEGIIGRVRKTEAGLPVCCSPAAPVGAPISEDFHCGHTGIDYAAPIGSQVVTVMDGMVTFCGWNPQGYGNLVIVENGRVQSWYAHLSSMQISTGSVVKSGDPIGKTGKSGYGTGPLLHFEVRLDGEPVDPLRFTDQGSIAEERE